jgi:hypothetical protein
MEQQTWDQLNTKLDLFLKDEPDPGADRVRIYTIPMRVAAWNWAQRFLAIAHTPRQLRAEVTADSDGRSVIVPADFLGVWRIYDEDQSRWMHHMPPPEGGQVYYNSDEICQYWSWGSTITLDKTVSLSGSGLVLYYVAYWPEIAVELQSDEETYICTSGAIVLPPWTILPVLHLTAATLMMPGAIEAARTRQWNIRVDSGTPTDNVRAQQAREHLRWWNNLLALVPPIQWRDHG